MKIIHIVLFSSFLTIGCSGHHHHNYERDYCKSHTGRTGPNCYCGGTSPRKTHSQREKIPSEAFP